MSANQIHISDAEMQALAATAAVGDFAVEDLVGAAAWAFAQQDADFKKDYVRANLLQAYARPLNTRSPHQPLKEKLYGLARRFCSLFG
jgi:hypothetical protein